jgi:hypothetical protein
MYALYRYVEVLDLAQCKFTKASAQFEKKHSRQHIFIVSNVSLKPKDQARGAMAFAADDEAEYDAWAKFLRMRCSR